MYKFELAVYAGITSKTFRRWTRPFDEELARMGVYPSTRLLPPAAVKFICEKERKGHFGKLSDAPRQKRTGGFANVVPLQSQLRNCNYYSIYILNF